MNAGSNAGKFMTPSAVHGTGINFLHHGIATRHDPPLCSTRFSGKCVMTQKQRRDHKKYENNNFNMDISITMLTHRVWL
jgi:hypothetical protein